MNTNLNTSVETNLTATMDTSVTQNNNKEEKTMKENTMKKNATKENNTKENNMKEKFITNGLYANYDAKKVQKVLETAESTERKAWYETQGVKLDNVTSLDTALKLSGLDFEVQKKPLYFNPNFEVKNEEGKPLPPKFTKIEGSFTTVRTDTNQPLGIVTDSYEILQNREAFDFLDSLTVQGAKFETAGFFKKNGAASYISMSTEPLEILGDTFEPYMMISNGHDGSSAIKVALTPVRAVCRNTAILALKRATNIVVINHSKKMYDRLIAAKAVMLANTAYMQELNKIAEELATKPFSEEAFEAMAKKLFPVNVDDSDIIQIRNIAKLEQLMKAYKENDLQNFNGTAWKAIQAVSDFESHPVQFRKAKKIAANGTPEFQVIMTGMPLLNKVFQMVNEAV